MFTQLLDAIVKEHEKIFEAACDHATQLASGDNVRSGDLLLAKVVELQELWEELKTEVERRDSLLQQAQLAQQVCVCLCVYALALALTMWRRPGKVRVS